MAAIPLCFGSYSPEMYLLMELLFIPVLCDNSLAVISLASNAAFILEETLSIFLSPFCISRIAHNLTNRNKKIFEKLKKVLDGYFWM